METMLKMNENFCAALGNLATAKQQPQPHHSYRKLPDLPIFSGEIMKWPLFKAELEQTSDQWHINDVENMSRLRKCLKGDALEAVQSLMVHQDNILEIMKTLERRFGRADAIIKNAIEQVRKVPAIKERHFDSVVSYACIVSNTVATIKSSGEIQYLTNPILLEEIVSKLPTSLCMNWLRASNSSKPNLEDFSKWLNVEADIFAAGSSFSAPTPTAAKEKAEEKKKGKCQVLATAEPDKPPQSPSSSQNKEKKCQLCKTSGHNIQSCKEFVKLPAWKRNDFAKTNRLCFGCLNYGHGLDKCRSKKPCPSPNCKLSHHKLLHDEPAHHASRSDTVFKPGESNPRDSARPPQVNTIGKVLLTKVNCQVVPVILEGPKSRKKVYAYLDKGSEYTLINDQLADELGLKGKTVQLEYQTIDKVGVVSSKIVSLIVENISNHNSYTLDSVRTFPNFELHGGTIRQSDLNRWKHLQGLDLQTYENCQPQILIGIDNAYLIESIRVGKLMKNAPVAAETKLG